MTMMMLMLMREPGRWSVDRERTVCFGPTRRRWIADGRPARRCSRCPWCCWTTTAACSVRRRPASTTRPPTTKTTSTDHRRRRYPSVVSGRRRRRRRPAAGRARRATALTRSRTGSCDAVRRRPATCRYRRRMPRPPCARPRRRTWDADSEESFLSAPLYRDSSNIHTVQL